MNTERFWVPVQISWNFGPVVMDERLFVRAVKRDHWSGTFVVDVSFDEKNAVVLPAQTRGNGSNFPSDGMAMMSPNWTIPSYWSLALIFCSLYWFVFGNFSLTVCMLFWPKILRKIAHSVNTSNFSQSCSHIHATTAVIFVDEWTCRCYIYLPWPPPKYCHSHSIATANHIITLDGASILSWAHDPDCQHTIACDTIEEGSLNHWAPTHTL